MKTSEEIKRGLEACLRTNGNTCEHCEYKYSEVPWCLKYLITDVLAYIQQLETENHQLLTKAQQLESTISQVSKALCGKEKATLKELLQAADQLKTRAPRWISVEERLPEDYEDVVIIMREGASSWYRVAYREYGGWSFGGGRRVNCEVTHWMPLPDMPMPELPMKIEMEGKR